MNAAIRDSLHQVEAAQGFRVLYACESGSRAWGFASLDSDFDVRFIFAWPRDEYLKVHLPAEHFHQDFSGDLDVTGWDVRKALHHFGKSNASFYEWLNSPVVYHDDGLRREWQSLMPAYFAPRAGAHHYLGLARQLWPEAGQAVSGKKLLYVLRAVLAARWIILHRQPPPVPFAKLLPLLESVELQQEVEQLVEIKQAAAEADVLPISKTLYEYLTALRATCESDAAPLQTTTVDFGQLDELCLRIIGTP